MVQVPAETKVTVVLETVQTEVVAEVKETLSELDALALSETVPEPRTLLTREPKVMLWFALLIVIVKLEVVAVALALSVTVTAMVELPAAVGVPVIAPVDELIDRPAGRVPVVTLKTLLPAPPADERASE